LQERNPEFKPQYYEKKKGEEGRMKMLGVRPSAPRKGAVVVIVKTRKTVPLLSILIIT
jgi:hypothetical protein